MDKNSLLGNTREFSAPYRITDGSKFRLNRFDPSDTGDLRHDHKDKGREILEQGLKALTELQDKLYAQDRYSLLLIFQAMDAAGKDGAIKHVMSGVNPQGCQVASFKTPSAEELDHDFLWRCNRHLPERGRIGIFNRSYYEEVLVVKVHPELLASQKLPGATKGDSFWEDRYKDISNFEKHLSHNGTVILKFFLNISRDEQKVRFLDRIENAEKNWKFSASDAKERSFWNDYMNAYEEMIRKTSTPYAPWYVVPANHKWYSRIIVASAIIDALESMNLRYPEVDAKKKSEFEEIRKILIREN